ncbi:unnamed protein product [Gongylonema pulchrum]|uniref:CCDC92 domain-containing protein n=1 Tax=Gongylonema pulchrum TaxID=637853 RepID=A0A183EK93_9BILA|nr:unnamed protein product [Gongylonema pulchrum]
MNGKRVDILGEGKDQEDVGDSIEEKFKFFYHSVFCKLHFFCLLQASQFDISPEMQKDISKLMTTISELERKNLDLSLQLKKQNEVTSSTPSEKCSFCFCFHLKLVELLNNQLLLVNDRCANLHRKIVKEGSSQTAYMDALKHKCEDLERRLSEQKASVAVAGLQIDSATTDEDYTNVSGLQIEQCCEVLASVEAQTNRICKQIEKIDNAQKDERRRSLSKDSSATIIAELASVISELNNVHQLLEAHKVTVFFFQSTRKHLITRIPPDPFREKL